MFDYLDNALSGVPPEETGLRGQEYRDYTALTLRVEGKTLDEIGAALGITRERARQIIERIAPGQNVAIKRRKLELDALRLEDLKKRISTWLIEHPGATVDEVAEANRVKSPEVPSLLSKRAALYLLRGNKTTAHLQNWTDSQISEAIRRAGTYHFPLSRAQYDSLVQTGEIIGPSAALIYKRFGSWTNACELAGVESNAAHDGYQVTWSRAELQAFLIRFLLQAETGSIQEYERWRTAQPDRVPSSQLVRNTWANWPNAVREALIECRRSWE